MELLFDQGHPDNASIQVAIPIINQEYSTGFLTQRNWQKGKKRQTLT